jgi:hypothetical protein
MSRDEIVGYLRSIGFEPKTTDEEVWGAPDLGDFECEVEVSEGGGFKAHVNRPGFTGG